MTVRKMIYLLIVAAVCVFGYTAWKLTSRSAYESAQYVVLQSAGNMELREYPDLMLATTKMGDRFQGDDGSFGRLFRYISGANEGKQKVAMTTPVFMEPQSDKTDNGQMSFVIPKEVADSEIPAPASDQVTVTKRHAGKFAVIRFSGRMDAEVSQKRQSQLQAWIEKQGYAVVDEPEIAGYDPPWTPGPFRRNEILMRVTLP